MKADIIAWVKEFLKKYGLFLFLFFLGIILTTFYLKCNKAKDSTAVTGDIVAMQLKESNLLCEKLQKKNDSLEELLKVNATKLTSLSANMSSMSIQQTQYINQIKQLTLDKGCQLAQKNYADTAKLIKIQYNGNIKICISEPQLVETNVSFETNKYLKRVNDSLNQQSLILFNSGDLSTQMVDNYKEILASKDSANGLLQQQNKQLQSDLNLMTKRYSRQRFWKYVFKGTTALFLIWAAVK